MTPPLRRRRCDIDANWPGLWHVVEPDRQGARNAHTGSMQVVVTMPSAALAG